MSKNRLAASGNGINADAARAHRLKLPAPDYH
jgi:hypothetical protein